MAFTSSSGVTLASALTRSVAGLKAETAEMTLSPAQENVLALITRKAITNVVRHAHARNCWEKLASDNGDCVLEIQDDDRVGVDLETEGNGLRGIHERIEELGGRLERDTSAGTRLHFEFPASTNGEH